MTILSHFNAATATDGYFEVPKLVGGMRWPDHHIHVTERHARLLYAWAVQNGITVHADVTVSAMQADPRRIGSQTDGPVLPLTGAEKKRIGNFPEREVSGWEFRIITETEVLQVGLNQYGDIRVRERAPVPALHPGDAPTDPDGQPPVDRLSRAHYRASALASAAQIASGARDAAIRSIIADHPKIGVDFIADTVGLSPSRVYQIKDGTR